MARTAINGVGELEVSIRGYIEAQELEGFTLTPVQSPPEPRGF